MDYEGRNGYFVRDYKYATGLCGPGDLGSAYLTGWE